MKFKCKLHNIGLRIKLQRVDPAWRECSEVTPTNFFKLWNEEYRDGIKTGGDKITLCINDVRRKFSANHYAYW